ncbi:MAG TPA: TlpA disulfide reductase family protein [Parasegetibacter sp.]
MMKKFSIFCMIMAFAGMISFQVNAQGNNAEPTLKVGMKAPKLEVGQWFKGEPVTEFKPGHVYVIEFWATWCGPCRAAMPHLSELSRHYKGKVTFIGLDVWEHGKEMPEGDFYEKARTFTQRLGDGMDYTVGADNPDKYLEQNWLNPAGIRGIPSSFVIDQKGDIVWIGHPINIDPVLEHVVNGTYNETTKAEIKKAADEQAAKNKEHMAKIEEYGNAKDYKNYIATMDKLINENPSRASSYIPIKFKIVLESDQKVALKMAKSLLKTEKSNPILLSNVANSILDSVPSNKKLTKVALSMAEIVGSRSLENDFSANQLLAKAYHAQGNVSKAVAAQQVVIDFLSSYPSSPQIDKMKADAQAALEKYKNGKK